MVALDLACDISLRGCSAVQLDDASEVLGPYHSDQGRARPVDTRRHVVAKGEWGGAPDRGGKTWKILLAILAVGTVVGDRNNGDSTNDSAGDCSGRSGCRKLATKHVLRKKGVVSARQDDGMRVCGIDRSPCLPSWS
jgi:hypothetical protein